MALKRTLLAGAAIALVAGCASVPYAQRLTQRQAAYTAAAGAPVNSFRFFTPLWSWEELGPDQVVIYTRPKEAWLLDVPGCTELPFANAIGLTSNLNQVSINFDKVITGRNNMPCTIQRIRPIDVGKLKAVQQEQRQVKTEPRQS
ncbi:DUF6491 family protein [Frateuria terrea]|uniref:Lipoprotein n=1 Tax=Frateuria terrea TaxID=529704 RepID=A0A1H6SEV0_9GAMM|nr:DUF6491 family protein [Frateuria terrea]SEI62520.1 hypothetical protein SAMN04487997_1237 [Frateuria terrea]SFP23477.1 hypothetical protein SAMN02927913_1152 [Frateuria terrea]